MAYRHEYEVRYSDCGAQGRVTPVALYGYLQETAIRHCDSVDLTTDSLLEKGVTWMLNRVHAQFLHYPAFHDTVRVETWPVNVSGLYSLREFRVFDGAERLCAMATTRWVLIDIHRKRPVRPPAFMADALACDAKRVVDDDFPRLETVDTPEERRTFHVRLSDLDINHHANSACYFDWLLETAPASILRSHVPGSVEIAYKREAPLGASLEAQSQTLSTETDGEHAFLHTLRDSETNETLAQGRSRWVPSP
jgi:medium-chain acyl-[acyl-carrier-protein] hydrolase